MARATWYRLDNIGKFYAAQAGSPTQTAFRFAATLTDSIDPELLQLAVDEAVQAFPGFNVSLRSGIFWHYLERVNEPPAVQPENLPICFGLHIDAKSTLIRVSYYRQRINLEVSHIVSDGRGTMDFFKVILAAYISRRYNIKGLQSDYDASDQQQHEDSFDRYYQREKAVKHRGPKVFRLTGRHDKGNPTYMEYHLPTGRTLELARQHGVTMTALLIAVIMCAIRNQMPQRSRHKAINISVPVDLRQHFRSVTTKNFFGLAAVSYTPGDDDASVWEVAGLIKEQLDVVTRAEHLKGRMNRMIALEKHPALRIAPMFAKDLALGIANWVASRKVTTAVSNLGLMRVDDRMSPYIQSVSVLTSTSGLDFVICSMGDDLSISISTVFANHDIIKDICRFFADEGIEGLINTNLRHPDQPSHGARS